MIPLSEINHFSNTLKIPAETIEKDYVISWVLYCLSKSSLHNNFIFYGGTAIKRVYFEEHRFSEDIDLISEKKFSLESILDDLSCLNYVRDAANLKLTILNDRIFTGKDRMQMYISYDGYEEIVGAPKEIRLDFAMDRDLFGQAKNQRIIETYSDLKNKNFSLPVMTLNTILANKFGLLLDRSRNEPRDLYDIWFLLHRLDKIDFDYAQFSKAFRDKYGYKFSTEVISNALKNTSMEGKWKERLGKQIPVLPEFDYIIQEINKNLMIKFRSF